MDVLTSAADAILREESDMVILTPTKDNTRPVLKDMTNNQQIIHFSSHKSVSSSLNSLFSDKITCNNLLIQKLNLKTPRKRRKNSTKFGDENQAPTPKTPKHEEHFDFSESPVTPLSNLKMLTRIASMEEHIPSKKDLFQTQSSLVPKVGLRRCVSENTKHSGSAEQGTKTKLKKYTTISDLQQSTMSQKINKTPIIGGAAVETSRREKSLGLLCERFLDHFPIEVSCLETPRRLVIDDVASLLGTERRRVYDIVNILECLNMASRVQKNMYQWMGKQHLETTLSKLKGLAEDWGLSVHMTLPIEQSLKDIKNGKTPTISPISIGEKSDARKEKSIGILCQKFLMLFLISQPPHVIQLETANHLLLGQEGDDLEKLRKRGRRIYDIANVLVALRLIKKLPQCKSFMYVGPLVDSIKSEEVEGQSQIRLRHSLLPPPITDFVLQKNMPHLNDDFVITPSEDNANSSLSRKGRPRKLATEFIHSKAKRNCLPSRTKSEESQFRQDFQKCPSLQDVCGTDEREKGKLTVVTPNDRNFNSIITVSSEPQRKYKPFRFTHLGSPRMALTFDNSSMRSPPSLTSRPPLPGANVSKVVVRPPFIFRKVSVPSVTQNDNSNKQQVFIIRTSTSGETSSPAQTSNTSILNDRTSGCFKVYSRNNRTLSLPSLPEVTKANTSPVTSLNRTTNEANEAKTFPKSHSQIIMPNISLNTLSRNHYKTVFGSASQIPSRNLSDPNQGLYHFVINSKETPQASQNGSGKDAKQPTFVKIFQTSPDNSSTDSELENIFGDSFKFTRPKNLVNKM